MPAFELRGYGADFEGERFRSDALGPGLWIEEGIEHGAAPARHLHFQPHGFDPQGAAFLREQGIADFRHFVLDAVAGDDAAGVLPVAQALDQGVRRFGGVETGVAEGDPAQYPHAIDDLGLHVGVFRFGLDFHEDFPVAAVPAFGRAGRDGDREGFGAVLAEGDGRDRQIARVFRHHADLPFDAVAGVAVVQGILVALRLAQHLEVLFQGAEIGVVVGRGVGGKDQGEGLPQRDRVAVQADLDPGGQAKPRVQGQ